MAQADFPSIAGFGHIDLTVTDPDRSAQWWGQVLGFKLASTSDRPDRRTRGTVHPCGLAVVFVAHSKPASDHFDERAVGLDHLAWRVPDRAALQAWAEHLDDLEIAHSGIQEELGGPLIVFRDPDNIQLELWAFDPELVRSGVNPAVTLLPSS
jgi:glyoxylase I family protein